MTDTINSPAEKCLKLSSMRRKEMEMEGDADFMRALEFASGEIEESIRLGYEHCSFSVKDFSNETVRALTKFLWNNGFQVWNPFPAHYGIDWSRSKKRDYLWDILNKLKFFGGNKKIVVNSINISEVIEIGGVK